MNPIALTEGLNKLHIPVLSGVYFLFKEEQLKYVGQCQNITKRVTSHNFWDWDECFYLVEKDPSKRVALETEMLKKYNLNNSNTYRNLNRDHRGTLRKPPPMTEKITSAQIIDNLPKDCQLVMLTPDDILTLRLLRDEEQSHAARWPDEKHRRLDDMRILDTLNHILKQVE